ncbi:GTPase-activating protein [Rhizopus azygosporus]|uniref:GTPase-activating protein n=1 Tax=Rhizopus azygosporus TaxID=86630 RepID=A0A367KC08_RHIAZ|nr:GTPase-activating protein [Rhizopus azygosporus]
MSTTAHSATPSVKRTTRRKPSFINLSNINNSISAAVSSPRTPRSISKSRRPSIVQEKLQTKAIPSPGNPLDDTVPTMLLSDTANSYFQQSNAELEESKHRYPTRHRSSSVSSLLSSNLLPNFEVHNQYKLKTTRSSKKLERFFGEDAPHDICVKEIRKEGLKAILLSKYPLCYFLYYLLEEYSSENLFFFIELEQYESFTYATPHQQIETAQHIYNTYLTRNSHFEVNLDDKVLRMVTQLLQQKNPKCFESAKPAVYTLLESSYMRFQSSETFDVMVKECGELTTYYSNETRSAAVNRLLNYIQISSNTATVSQATRKRHELLRLMIYEFCRTCIGVNLDCV